MLRGLDFAGTDINPLAVLLCRVKSGPFHLGALEAAGARITVRARADKSRRIELGGEFGWEKWFRDDVAAELSRLRRAIRQESQVTTRRFLWIALAETVRLSSNSRTSTVKLHIRPKDEAESREIDVAATFGRVFGSNLKRFASFKQALGERGQLRRGWYRGSVEIHLHDISSGPVPRSQLGACSLLLTSPPYGDNASTVPYGQHAYLPLQWIDLCDIDSNADSRFLASTHAIDAMSLGAPRRGALDQVAALRAISPSLDETLDRLATHPRDRAQRVAAFWRDMDAAAGPILHHLADSGLAAWTVGNRSVGGREVPMDRILSELLNARGCRLLCVLPRTIPDQRKRMASRNSVSTTMSREKVLVFRYDTGGSDG